jgi:hypothetical protein
LAPEDGVPESFESARRPHAASHPRQASSDLAAIKRPGKVTQNNRGYVPATEAGRSVYDNMPQRVSRRTGRPESRRSPPTPDTRSGPGCGQALHILDKHWTYAERNGATVRRELVLVAGFVVASIAGLLGLAVSAALFVGLVMYAEHVTQAGSLSALVVLLALTGGGFRLALRRRR